MSMMARRRTGARQAWRSNSASAPTMPASFSMSANETWRRQSASVASACRTCVLPARRSDEGKGTHITTHLFTLSDHALSKALSDGCTDCLNEYLFTHLNEARQ